MGWVGRCFVGLNVLAAWALLAYIVTRGFSLGTAAAPFTSVEFISLILGALAVMIAVLTVFLAVLALWGYNSLREAAREIATAEAKRTAEEVAGRTTRTLQDQESGQGSGDEYARAAVGHADGNSADSG